MINWKVRIRNKAFWLAIVPAILLLAQTIAAPFGYEWDFIVLNQQITALVNAVFSVLTILGITNDPTTAGINDSDLAMTYEKPKEQKLIEAAVQELTNEKPSENTASANIE